MEVVDFINMRKSTSQTLQTTFHEDRDTVLWAVLRYIHLELKNSNDVRFQIIEECGDWYGLITWTEEQDEV